MTSTEGISSNFKWSFSTLGCPEFNLDQCCDLALEFGIDSFEARAIEQRIDLPKLFTEQFGTPDKLATHLKDRGVTITCFDTSLKLPINDEAARKEFLEFLPWADAAGTKYLRAFDGGTVDGGLDDETFKASVETIEWWRKEKEASGWKAEMAVETHDAIVGKESLARLLEYAPELPILWDTHHTWKKAGDSLEESWEAVKNNVVNVHIKDSITKPSARHPFTYVNLGDGEFPLDDALALLKKNSYAGVITVEWERMWHPYLLPLRDALSRARSLNWF